MISISEDEFVDIIIRDWINLQNRDHRLNDFETVFDEVSNECGIDYVNGNKFCKKHIESWRESLRLLKEGYDFREETSKLIVNDLSSMNLIPINGRDIMEEFNISGPQVGMMLEKARDLFRHNPCSKAELIRRLK